MMKKHPFSTLFQIIFNNNKDRATGLSLAIKAIRKLMWFDSIASWSKALDEIPQSFMWYLIMFMLDNYFCWQWNHIKWHFPRNIWCKQYLFHSTQILRGIDHVVCWRVPLNVYPGPHAIISSKFFDGKQCLYKDVNKYANNGQKGYWIDHIFCLSYASY